MFPGHPELPDFPAKEEAYLKLLLRKGQSQFEIREVVSMLRRLHEPRAKEIVTIQSNIPGKITHLLVYVKEAFLYEDIPLLEFATLEGYFSEVELYLRYEMKKRKYKSVRKYGIYPYILEFSRTLSIDPAENL